MKYSYRIALFFLIAVLIVGVSLLKVRHAVQSGSGKDPLVRQIPVMGTFAEIKLYGNPETANSAALLIQDKFQEVEKNLSIFDPKSEASMMNSTAYEKPFKCSGMLWEIIRKSRHFYELSDHGFDVSAGPLMELWGFYKKTEKLPDQVEIDKTLARTGLDKVIFDDEARTVRFTVPGMRLDFGGIAKGYAVDLAAESAKSAGIKSGIINLGGNLYCFGEPPPGKTKYTVGIRNPFNVEDICGTVEIIGRSVSTSGNYEKYVVIEGRRFTHIMNPKTGLPVEGMIAVSIITDSACDADALSTSFFVKGKSILENVVSEFPGIQILMIGGDAKENAKVDKIGTVWPEKLEF